MLKGLKIKFKQQEEEKDQSKMDEDPLNSKLNKRLPETIRFSEKEENDEQDEDKKEDSREEEKKIGNGGFKKKYDFSAFENRNDEHLIESQENKVVSGDRKEISKNIESLKIKSDEIWEMLKQGDLNKTNSNLNDLDNSVYRWIHSSSSAIDQIFGNQLKTSKSGPTTSSEGVFNDSVLNLVTQTGMLEEKGASRQAEGVKIFHPQKHDYDAHLRSIISKKAVKNMDHFVEQEYDSIHPDLEPGKKEGKAYLKRVANRQSAISRKEERVLSSCRFCLANGFLKEEEILSISDNFCLVQPNISISPIISSFLPWKTFPASPVQPLSKHSSN